MGEELADVTETVGVQTMRRVVNVFEDLLELLGINFVDCAEALRQQSVKLLVSSLLSATVEEHVAQLSLLTRLQLHLHQLMCAFLEIQTRMNREVDRSSQRNQIRLGVVDDLLLLSDFFFVFT